MEDSEFRSDDGPYIPMLLLLMLLELEFCLDICGGGGAIIIGSPRSSGGGGGGGRPDMELDLM